MRRDDSLRGHRAPDDGSDPSTEERTRVEWSLPGDDSAHTCSYCGRPFAREEYLALHRGLAHGDALADDELAAYRAAFEAERDAIRRFRLKALGGLVLVYFLLLMGYVLV